MTELISKTESIVEDSDSEDYIHIKFENYNSNCTHNIAHKHLNVVS